MADRDRRRVSGAIFDVGAYYANIYDNLVSGNSGKGINLEGAAGGILGDLIGTDVSGVLPLGNRSTGVSINAAERAA